MPYGGDRAGQDRDDRERDGELRTRTVSGEAPAVPELGEQPLIGALRRCPGRPAVADTAGSGAMALIGVSSCREVKAERVRNGAETVGARYCAPDDPPGDLAVMDLDTPIDQKPGRTGPAASVAHSLPELFPAMTTTASGRADYQPGDGHSARGSLRIGVSLAVFRQCRSWLMRGAEPGHPPGSRSYRRKTTLDAKAGNGRRIGGPVIAVLTGAGIAFTVGAGNRMRHGLGRADSAGAPGTSPPVVASPSASRSPAPSRSASDRTVGGGRWPLPRVPERRLHRGAARHRAGDLFPVPAPSPPRTPSSTQLVNCDLDIKAGGVSD